MFIIRICWCSVNSSEPACELICVLQSLFFAVPVVQYSVALLLFVYEYTLPSSSFPLCARILLECELVNRNLGVVSVGLHYFAVLIFAVLLRSYTASVQV